MTMTTVTHPSLAFTVPSDVSDQEVTFSLPDTDWPSSNTSAPAPANQSSTWADQRGPGRRLGSVGSLGPLSDPSLLSLSTLPSYSSDRQSAASMQKQVTPSWKKQYGPGRRLSRDKGSSANTARRFGSEWSSHMKQASLVAAVLQRVGEIISERQISAKPAYMSQFDRSTAKPASSEELCAIRRNNRGLRRRASAQFEVLKDGFRSLASSLGDGVSAKSLGNELMKNMRREYGDVLGRPDMDSKEDERDLLQESDLLGTWRAMRDNDLQQYLTKYHAPILDQAMTDVLSTVNSETASSGRLPDPTGAF